MDMTRIDPGLEGVPETLLWTLYHRALEARRPDAVLHDPTAVDLVDRIDYPFAERFGTGGLSQWQALRVLAFDREVRRFLQRHPDGTVVALGEGLETQCRRVDNGRARWIGVDLPETVEVRRRLLPDGPRHRTIACSVLDEAWMDEVDARHGALLTAQGLLMYLDPPGVHRVIERSAARFPGAGLVFDAVPRWLAAAAQRAREGDAGGYRPPPWTWTIDRAERRRIAALPGVADLRTVPLPRGRGVVHGFLLPLATRLPVGRTALLTVLSATFRTA
jgi:O-methyltransferase involved in polyketide biosynthesis